MRKRINPKKFLSCALLMLSGISSLHAAKLTVTVTDSIGGKLPGAFVYWGQSNQAGQTNKLGTGTGITDANGVVTGDIPDGISYKVKVVSCGTSRIHPVSFSGPVNGNNILTDTFQTASQLIIEAKSGGVDVAGVGVEYIDGSSWRSAGPTGANGKKVMQVFPFSTLTVRANASGSLDTRTVSSANPIVSFDNLVKLQSPNTELIVAGSWMSANTGRYVFPNTYQSRINVNNSYSGNVKVEGSLFNKVPVVILVKDHNNDPIPGATLRGGYGTIPNGGGFGWHCTPTDSKGITIEWANAGNNICSYEASVNGTTATQTKDVTVTNGNIFTFKSSQLTLRLQDCDSNGIAGGSARYGIGSNYSTWYVPGTNQTNANGIMIMEAFPGTYSFEMGINQSTQVKTLVFTGKDTLYWTSSKVSVNWPYGVAFGGAGGNAWFPNKAGTQMLPGTWNFRFDGPMGQTFAPITVSGCSVNKTPIMVRLLQSNGTPIANGQPQYYAQNVWNAMPVTDASGNSIEMLDANPGATYMRLSYLGGTQELIQDLTANPVVTYKTTPVTIDFKASNNSPLDGTNLLFYSDSWRTFNSGKTTNGQETLELLPLNYYFRLSYQGATQEQQQNVAANNQVLFQTKAVTIDFQDSKKNHSLVGESLLFYSDSWRSFTADANIHAVSTTGGTATLELLPLNYYFRLSYQGATEEKQQNVAADATVLFQTKEVTIDFTDSRNAHTLEGTDLKFYSDTWRNFTTGTGAVSTTNGVKTLELLPLNYYFRLSYQGATEEKQQNVASNSIVSFRTTPVVFDFKASNNKTCLTGERAQFYSDSWRDFQPSIMPDLKSAMELLPMNYYFRLSFMGATEEKQQNVASDPTVRFRTTEVTMEVRDAKGKAQKCEDLKFYSDKWRTFGVDKHGPKTETMELLPGNYYFGLTYKGSALEKQQNVAIDPLVTFIIGSNARMIEGTTAAETVSLYPNPAINNVHVSMPAAGTVEIYSIDGKKLAQYEVSEGTATIDISTLPVGNHIMIAHYGEKTETIKFVKL